MDIKNNLLKEAIILAGGFGTRLRDVVADVPKSMAPINGKPFLDYQLKYIKHYGIEKIVLSVGYLSEKIIAHYGNSFEGLQISYSVEKEPLGTGGGIRLAMEKCKNKDVLVLNGDSIFDFDLNSFFDSHTEFQSTCSLALRKVENASRYGTVTLSPFEGGRSKSGGMSSFKEGHSKSGGMSIRSFNEKNKIEKAGIISAGVYIFNRELYLQKTEAIKPFSIEKDFFETRLNEIKILGFEQEGYFLDIGIPEDYKKAQHDFKQFKY